MKIAIDTVAWAANPKIDAAIAVPVDAEVPTAYRFMLPARSEVITAIVTDAGANIDIQPERSASHRALREALQS